MAASPDASSWPSGSSPCGDRAFVGVPDGARKWPFRSTSGFRPSHGDKFVLESLPPYAPELNPVEYIWARMKQRELANLCRETIGQVGAYARNRLKSMQRRPRLIAACWKQAELPI